MNSVLNKTIQKCCHTIISSQFSVSSVLSWTSSEFRNFLLKLSATSLRCLAYRMLRLGCNRWKTTTGWFRQSICTFCWFFIPLTFLFLNQSCSQTYPFGKNDHQLDFSSVFFSLREIKLWLHLIYKIISGNFSSCQYYF